MELVVHRRMNERGDPLVEHGRPLAAEEQVVSAYRGSAHPERLAASGEALSVCDGERLAADRGLAMPPALVVTAEGSVVHVPGGDRSLVELLDELVADGAATVDRIDRLVQPGQLVHRDRVEADAVAGSSDLVGEGSQHLVLPLEVWTLLLAVANTE